MWGPSTHREPLVRAKAQKRLSGEVGNFYDSLLMTYLWKPLDDQVGI